MSIKKILKILLRSFWTIVLKGQCQSYGKALNINHFCRFGGEVYLGDNCNFNGIHILGNGTVIIGDNFHSGKECMILTQNHNYEGLAIPYDHTYIKKRIIIEDNVWLGNRVLLVGNLNIGEGAIVAAGSVVVKDIPRCAIVGGNPARIIKYRDIGHYEKLKSEGKFH